MESLFPLTDYIKRAMAEAVYEELEEGSWAGTIPACLGVLAFAPDRASCEIELQSTLEDWMLVQFRMGDPLPIVGGIDLNLGYVSEPVDAA